MACKLYMQYKGNTISLGKFKNQKKALEFWELYRNSLKSCKGSYPKAIFVENRKHI